MNSLKKMREKVGFSRKEAAEKMCMSEAQYGRRERGDTPLTEDEIIIATKVYGCELKDILGDKKDE